MPDGPLRRAIAVMVAICLAAGTEPRAQEGGPTAIPRSSDLAVHDSLRPLVDRALRTSAAEDFDRALAVLGAARTAAPHDPVLAHYHGFVLYRKASVIVTTIPGNEEAKRLFEEAARALEASLSLGWGETRALQSAIVGQLIGFSGPFGGLRMGPRAQRLLDEAVAMAPRNPRVLMLRGVSYLYRPRLLGGGVEKAERDLRQSIALFANDAPVAPAPWWGRAEAHGWLGETLARQGKAGEAREQFARALELEPGNVWVRDFLMAALDRKR